jgi:hypothetical protein
MCGSPWPFVTTQSPGGETGGLFSPPARFLDSQGLDHPSGNRSTQFVSCMKKLCRNSKVKLQPRIPGLTRQMVQNHAARLFRDILRQRPLTPQEWSLAEEDLARKLERDGF